MNVRPTKHTEEVVVTALRGLLGILFIWLGLLHTGGYGPVLSDIGGSLPYFGFSGGAILFGVITVCIGILLLVSTFWWLAEPLLILYMIGTGVVFAVEPTAVFQPEFPLLSVVGELLLKNLALGIAGIMVMIHENRRQRNHG